MASTMSRRFSTMEFSAPTYQKDMTNDVRLKLAKVRARSRSFCAPSSPPTATPAKKSSQLPRSSVTALTTSAKAKLRSPQSNQRNTNNTTSTANASTSINAPEPNSKRHHYQHSTCTNRHSTTAAPTVNSTSSKLTSQRFIQRTKSTKSTKKTHDSNTNYYNDDDDMMIKFFESDSDEDDLFLRNKIKPSDDQTQRRKRRTTMPPRLNVSTRRLSTSSYSPERSPSPVDKDDNADKNHTQSMWAELQELKSRLAKLEVQAPPTPKKSSICSPPITRPSSMTSVLLSPHSSLVDSACSISNNEISTQSQKVLQDTVLHLEQHLRQDDDPNNADNNNTFMNTLVDLVAETISINQSLSYLTSQQQQQLSSGHLNSNLSTLHKSSERQINLLADALQLFDIHRQQQQPVLDHPASPPLSQSAMDNRIGNISPKPQSSLRNAQVSVQPQRQSTQSRAYSLYYDDSASQNYADDASSQHSNLLTTSFHTKHQQQQQQRQQQHRRSIASVATAPSHYTRYLDQEMTPTRQFYQQQQQQVSSRPVSGILHHNLPSSSSYQQPQRYYTSTVQPKPQPTSQSAFQPMTSRVNRLLSMYEASLKPTTTLMTNATSSPPMSPPSVQHYQQVSYIDYQTQS